MPNSSITSAFTGPFLLAYHRYVPNADQLSKRHTEEVPQRFKTKLEEFGKKGKSNLNNRDDLEIFAAEMAKIPASGSNDEETQAFKEKRSAMVILLTERLIEIASDPEHSLNESHVKEMLRLKLEHTCHTAYRDTPDAKWPTAAPKDRTHSAKLWRLPGQRKEELSLADDTNIVSSDARIRTIECVKRCLVSDSGGPTTLPLNDKTLGQMGFLVEHNVARLNKQSDVRTPIPEQKEALKDAALRIIREPAADELRFKAAAILLQGATSMASAENTKRVTASANVRERNNFLMHLPTLPPNPRIKEDKPNDIPFALYRRKNYPAPSDKTIPIKAVLYNDLRDIIVPAFQAALSHAFVNANNRARLDALKDVVRLDIEFIRMHISDTLARTRPRLSSADLEVRERQLDGAQDAFMTQLDRDFLTVDEILEQVNMFIEELERITMAPPPGYVDDDLPTYFTDGQGQQTSDPGPSNSTPSDQR